MECYLCGTENSPDADFCERCDGQLLRIPTEPDQVEPDIEDLYLEEEEDEEPKAPRRKRARLIRSAEHRRLQAALGLDDEEEVDNEDGSSNTIVPTVKTIAVPHIGTRTAKFDVGGVRTETSNRKIFIAFGVLTLLIAFFAYKAFQPESTEPAPDEIAFSDSTIPLAPVEEEVERPWSQVEVSGKFAPSFVTVIVYACTSNEVVSEEEMPGLAIDENNVIFGATTINQPTVVRIQGQFGSSVLARFNRHESGLNVATTDRTLTRTIGIVEEPNGEQGHFITRNPESSTTVVGEENEGSPSSAQTIGVEVSTQGDPLAAWIGARKVSLEMLTDIGDYEALVDPDAETIENPSLCQRGRLLIDSTPVPESDDTTADTSNEEETTAEEETSSG